MLSTAELAALSPRDYTNEVKNRLRNNEAWLEVLHPSLAERTRFTLVKLIDSVESQRLRAVIVSEADERWLSSIGSLQRLARSRLDVMPRAEAAPPSSRKEAQAWRSFAAQLAFALSEGDPTAMDRIKTPYGGLTAREWMVARAQKAREAESR